MPTTPPDIALVLGAGGARGYAHLGVINVLRRAGVPINMIAGASVGSVVGALYADHGSWQQAYRSMMAATFWTFADISTVPRLSGMMTGYHLEEFIHNQVQAKDFRQLAIPLAITTTDLYHGKAFLIRSGPIAPAVRASSSIPGLVQPSKLYNRTLVDGGVTDPLPVDVAKLYHPKLIIAVDIDKQFIQETPATNVGILRRSIVIMARKLAKLSVQGADVIIAPKLGQASTFEVSDAQFLYRQGQIAARKALPKILRLMQQRGIKKQPDSARR